MNPNTSEHLPINSLTLFSISNLEELNFSYKLVPINITQIDGLESKTYADLMNITYKIGSLTQGPAVVITRNNKKYVAIPSDRTFDSTIYEGKTGKVKIELPQNAQIHQLRFNNCDEQEYHLIEKFLEFSLRKQVKEKYDLIEDGAGKLFPKQPMFFLKGANAAMFEGFSFRIVPEGKSLAHICIDLTHRNIAQFPLSNSVKMVNKDREKGKYTSNSRGRKALLKFGDMWFPIEILGFGDTISEQTFIDKNNQIRTVYEYTITETQKHRNKVVSLDPNEVSVIYCFPDKRSEMPQRFCASSLVYLLYSTQDEEVRNMHSNAILKTYKRFKNLNQIVFNFFQNLKYEGKRIKINYKPKQEVLPVLKSNDLLFANNYRLSLYNSKTNNIIEDLGKKRKNGITRNGILGVDDFDPQYIFAPKNGEEYEVIEGVFDGFKRDFAKKLNDLTNKFEDFRRIIYYDYYPNLSAKEQVDIIKQAAINAGVGEGCAIFVMPDVPQYSKKRKGKNEEKLSRLHNCLKRGFFQMKLSFQCVTYSELERHYEPFFEDNGVNFKVVNNVYGFDNQLFYLALEYLNLNRMFPYALAQNLNYNIYIGIDVHDRYAGFCFLYKDAQKIHFAYKEIPLKSKHVKAEKLTEEQILEVVEPILRKHISKYCPNPNGMVIVRDGNSHGGEEKAAIKLVDKFSDEKLIDKEKFEWAVVDLHKKSVFPLRSSLTLSPERKNNELPTIGTVKKLGRNYEEAFMFNTGFPFDIRGSVKPVHYTHIAGNANFDNILEDLFSQTILAFSAPDRPNSLPIIIKLLDFYLGSWAYGEQTWNNEDDSNTLIPLDFREDEFFEEEIINDVTI
jgi:hypothetical protein